MSFLQFPVSYNFIIRNFGSALDFCLFMCKTLKIYIFHYNFYFPWPFYEWDWVFFYKFKSHLFRCLFKFLVLLGQESVFFLWIFRVIETLKLVVSPSNMDCKYYFWALPLLWCLLFPMHFYFYVFVFVNFFLLWHLDFDLESGKSIYPINKVSKPQDDLIRKYPHISLYTKFFSSHAFFFRDNLKFIYSTNLEIEEKVIKPTEWFGKYRKS